MTFAATVNSIINAGLKPIFVDSKKDEFNIDKDNQVFVKSMVAVPFKVQKLEGVKGGTKKVKNTDTELVPVHTGIIDKVWNTKYPSNITPRQKGKAVNISKMLNDKLLAKLPLEASKEA